MTWTDRLRGGVRGFPHCPWAEAARWPGDPIPGQTATQNAASINRPAGNLASPEGCPDGTSGELTLPTLREIRIPPQ